MTDRIRVLFAIPQLDRDGPDRVMFEVLSGLDRSKFEARLMVSKPSGHYLQRLRSDIHVTVLGDTGSLTSRYPVVAATKSIRATAPHVVLSTLRMNLTLGIARPLLGSRTRLIIRQANDFSANFGELLKRSRIKHRLARRLALASFRQADAIVCQSNAMRDDLARVLGADTKLHVIGNPVDVAAVSRASVGSTAVLPGDPALVSVGRLSSQKGHDILLGALAIVRETLPGIHLTILGDGPECAALEALTTRLSLSSCVTFAGFSDDVLCAVRAADVFVLASRYEGFPNAALEALACGTPVVLTDCPGANSEIVMPGVNGRLAETTTPESVAKALLQAVSELPDYSRREIAATTDVRFSSRTIVRRYEGLFEAVVRTRNEERSQEQS